MRFRLIRFLLVVLPIAGVGFPSVGQDSAESDSSGIASEMAEMITATEVTDAVPEPRAVVTETELEVEAQTQVMELDRRQELLDKANAEVVRLQGLLKEALGANRREQFAMHYNMGCAYKSQGQYRKAERHFLMALEARPSEPDIHYNLGILYDDDMKDTDKARKHYLRFVELAPDDEDAARVQEWLLSLAP